LLIAAVGTQIARSLHQDVRVVSGKAEHAVAAAAKEFTHLVSRVTMIDGQDFLGFRFLSADFAYAALAGQHGVVIVQGYPVDCLESRLTPRQAITRALPFAIFGIRLHFEAPTVRKLFFVGLFVGPVGRTPLLAIFRILCIFLFRPFAVGEHLFSLPRFRQAASLAPEQDLVRACGVEAPKRRHKRLKSHSVLPERKKGAREGISGQR
jgi:hypothetical protein